MGQFSHSTLNIDLKAVQSNYRTLRQLLSPQSKLSAAVKANAYGVGAREVTKALKSEGCTDFFVANLDEAIDLLDLFESPQTRQIYIFHGVELSELETYHQQNITPILNCLSDIEALQAKLKAQNKRLKVAVHFDTGMHRLGLNAEETARFTAQLKSYDQLEFTHWLSHLASSDDPLSPQNEAQLALFKSIIRNLPKAQISFANSSGLFLGAEYHFDLGRPGFALYGGNPTPAKSNPMKPVVTLTAQLLQVKKIAAGSTVGYSATYKASQEMRVGTIPIGYADGYMRCLSNRGQVFIGGKSAPIIGRVSMDLTMIDLSANCFDTIGQGSDVEMIGPHYSIDDMARDAGTIGYEVLTSLGQRYKRVY